MILARLLFVFLLLTLPARAADVVYPTGSRIGLAPPPGLTLSKTFLGFEDRANFVALVIVPLPRDTFAEIAKTSTPEALAKQGITLEQREEITHPLGRALLAVGSQEMGKVPLHKWIFVVETPDIAVLVTAQVPEAAKNAYPAQAIRAALMSVSIRAEVPLDEQLSLLPFRVTELANFKVGGVMAGRAIMLTDAATTATAPGIETHMVIAIVPGAPPQVADRDSFARDAFAGIPNLKDVRINSSESLRISGAQGHQIMARGKDAATGTEITIVQWLRFGGGAYLHLVGVTRTEGWTAAYARFRQVRDGVVTR